MSNASADTTKRTMRAFSLNVSNVVCAKVLGLRSVDEGIDDTNPRRGYSVRDGWDFQPATAPQIAIAASASEINTL